MARKRSRRLRRIAQQTAAVKFGPEQEALNMALQEAGAARDASIDAARATGAGLRAAIKQARPNLAKNFDEGRGILAANAGLIGANMPTSGPGAAILAAQAAEHQAAMDANATARTGALADLTQQRVRAQEGATYGVNSARSQYQGDVAKVLQQLLGLSQREGEFAAAEYGRLNENALDRDQDNREFAETKRHNRANERAARDRLKASAKSKNGKKWESNAAHGDLGDKISDALHWANLLKKGGASREAVEAALAAGRPSGTVYETVTDARGNKKRQAVLNPDGTEKKTREIPSFGSGLFLDAALDQAFGGHVSRRTTRQLHSRGFLIRKLPVTSYAAWKRAARNRTYDRPPLAAGPNGQQRPT